MKQDKDAKMKAEFASYNEWYKAEPRLKEYEDFAWRTISEAGYPSEWNAFCEAFDNSTPPEPVAIANAIFYGVTSVRNAISTGNPETAALEMMRLCNKAFRLNFKIVEPELLRDEKRQAGCSFGGTVSGQARTDEAKQRHQEILKEAEKLLTGGRPARDLAGVLAQRFGLSDRQIRSILKGDQNKTEVK